MQPTFLPWQGFFALVAFADVFVFLDDFQFQRHSFHQRNRLRMGDGSEAWVTVPVAHPKGEFPALSAAETVVDDKWRRRIKATLDQSYGRAAYHGELRPAVDAWLDTAFASLAEMNIAFIQWVATSLGFAPEWQRSSALGATGERSERVLDLLRKAGAREYLAARGSFEYMRDDAVFPVDDVDVVFQEFEPVPYAQRKATEFISHLSVLDALFEVGADATRALVLEGQRSWVPWDAMAATAAATRVAP
jgi:hypothetical protein